MPEMDISSENHEMFSTYNFWSVPGTQVVQIQINELHTGQLKVSIKNENNLIWN